MGRSITKTVAATLVVIAGLVTLLAAMDSNSHPPPTFETVEVTGITQFTGAELHRIWMEDQIKDFQKDHSSDELQQGDLYELDQALQSTLYIPCSDLVFFVLDWDNWIKLRVAGQKDGAHYWVDTSTSIKDVDDLVKSMMYQLRKHPYRTQAIPYHAFYEQLGGTCPGQQSSQKEPQDE